MQSNGSESLSSEYSVDDAELFDLNDIYTYLLDRQGRLTSLLEEFRKVEENNVPIESGDEDSFLRFKSRFFNLLLNEIHNLPPQQWWQFPSLVQLRVKRTLKDELVNVRVLLEEKKKKLQEDKRQLAGNSNLMCC